LSPTGVWGLDSAGGLFIASEARAVKDLASENPDSGDGDEQQDRITELFDKYNLADFAGGG